MISVLKKLFGKDTDRRVTHITTTQIHKPLEEAGISAEKLTKLLKKNGVTMQIYIATGGDKRGH